MNGGGVVVVVELDFGVEDDYLDFGINPREFWNHPEWIGKGKGINHNEQQKWQRNMEWLSELKEGQNWNRETQRMAWVLKLQQAFWSFEAGGVTPLCRLTKRRLK